MLSKLFTILPEFKRRKHEHVTRPIRKRLLEGVREPIGGGLRAEEGVDPERKCGEDETARVEHG